MSYYQDLKAWYTRRGEFFSGAVTLLLLIAIFYFVTKNIKYIDILIEEAGPWGPLAAIIIYVFLALTPISTEPVTLFTGVLFGPVAGIIIGWMGNNLGGFTEYFIGRTVGRSEKLSFVKDKLPFGLNKLPVGSPYVLIFGRAIPGYGGKVINFMAGMYEVSIKTFFWTTFAINLIGSVLLSFGGYNLIRLIHIR